MPNASPAHRSHRSQMGFLLVEFVVGMGLASILATVVVSAVYQVYKASDSGERKLQTLTEVQKATIWLLRDIRKASTTDLSDGGPSVGNAEFNWNDSGGSPHTCSYALSATNLERTCDSITSVAARKVSGLAFSRDGGLVTITFTVTPDAGASYAEDVSLNVSMRAS